MSTTIEYDKILGKTANELFEEYSVEELGKLMTRLSDDVNTKKQKLKLLVGNKYRDLLNVADDIIRMNDVTSVENEELMKLAFKKSDYNSKSLPNLFKFNLHIQQLEIERVQDDNRSIILRNVVHDLNYNLINLKQNLLAEVQSSDDINSQIDTVSVGNINNSSSIDIDENFDYYKALSSTISNGFVVFAKQIYLIKYFFGNDIKEHPELFAVIKYKQLCEEFNTLLEVNVMKLKHDVDSDFILNIFVSYLVAKSQSPKDVLQWLLDKRLKYFEQLANTHISFQELLSYVFITIQYITSIYSRLSYTMGKLRANTGTSNWIQQTSFQKWSKWIHKNHGLQSDGYNPLHYDFFLDTSRISKSDFENIMSRWNLNVSNSLLVNFNSRFDKSKNLTDLVILLRYTLTSFKHFSSLTKLPVGEENFVDFILSKWKNEYIVKLTDKLNEFENIGSLILKNFEDNDAIQSIIKTSTESCLFEFNSDFNMNSLLEILTDKKETDEVFILLDKFKQDLKSTSISIESLKSLATLVLKPILTNDDYEDDEFWAGIAENINNILAESVTNSVSILNKSINDFFANVASILNNDISNVANTKIFYLMRILVQLEEKIKLAEFYETFYKYSKHSSNNRIELSELVEPLLEKCFQLIVTHTYDSNYLGKIKGLLEQRFNCEKHYSEFLLWEQTSDEKSLPTICSTEHSELLLSLCNDLIKVDGQNYSNVYTLPSFDKVRKDTVQIILKQICDFMQTLEEPKEEDQKANFKSKVLLTYSDFLFTSFFIESSSLQTENYTEIFVNLCQSLTENEYRNKIQNSILENYKNQCLLYYPLSN